MVIDGDEMMKKAEIIWSLFGLKAKGLIKDFEVTETGVSIEFPDDMYSDNKEGHLAKIPSFITH